MQSGTRDLYAYRHHLAGGTPGMQTLRFDGHVAGVSKDSAIRSVELWYPSGAQVSPSGNARPRSRRSTSRGRPTRSAVIRGGLSFDRISEVPVRSPITRL